MLTIKITGEIGDGKTTVLALLVQALNNNGITAFPVEDEETVTTFESLLRNPTMLNHRLIALANKPTPIKIVTANVAMSARPGHLMVQAQAVVSFSSLLQSLMEMKLDARELTKQPTAFYFGCQREHLLCRNYSNMYPWEGLQYNVTRPKVPPDALKNDTEFSIEMFDEGVIQVLDGLREIVKIAEAGNRVVWKCGNYRSRIQEMPPDTQVFYQGEWRRAAEYYD